MDIVELKRKIETNSLDDSILIFKYSDNKFLCYHYINYIAKNKNKELHYIKSLNDLNVDDDLFDFNDNFLNVLDVEVLNEYPTNDLKNLIIVCKSLPKDLKVDYIDIIKLVNWQIEDFIKSRLTGLDDSQITWLCQSSKYDIYRLDNECKKLELFSPGFQKIIFEEQLAENAYCDLNSNSIFNLTEAIIKKDVNEIKNILKGRDFIDIEPMGFVNILLKNYYKLLVVLSTNNWSESLSNIVSDKQYRFYKAVYGKQYSITSLIKIYEILTSIDYQLKSGQLDYDTIIDYLIIKLMSV